MKYEYLHIRIRKELKEKIKEEAKKNDVPINTYIVMVLKENLK